jgi:NADH:ubiquinone oxidoreductase subunit C
MATGNRDSIVLDKGSVKEGLDVPSNIVNSISGRFGSNAKIIYNKPGQCKILVNPENIVEAALFLRDNFGFDHVESASGTDFPNDNQIEVNYHLNSYSNQDLFSYALNLGTRVDRENSQSNSLINILPSVEYFERETHEMLGVYFIGHPRNERFLLPEDWADLPPLRKDFRIKGR